MACLTLFFPFGSWFIFPFFSSGFFKTLLTNISKDDDLTKGSVKREKLDAQGREAAGQRVRKGPSEAYPEGRVQVPRAAASPSMDGAYGPSHVPPMHFFPQRP